MKPIDFIDLCCELATRLNVVFVAPGNRRMASCLLLVFAENGSFFKDKNFCCRLVDPPVERQPLLPTEFTMLIVMLSLLLGEF